jgi:hypothetical protein
MSKPSPHSFNIQPMYHTILKEMSKQERTTIANLLCEAIRLLVLNRLVNRRQVNLEHLQHVLTTAGVLISPVKDR